MYASREAENFLADLLRPEEASWRYLKDRVIGPNVDSEFGRRHNFAKLQSLADYQAAVPIRNYEGFRADCDRLVAGEQGILTTEPVKRFFTTSGSTNKAKYIPVTNSFIRDKSRAFGIYWSLVFGDHPAVKSGRMVTNFSDAGLAKTGPQVGLPVGSESAYWAGVTAATQRKEPLIPKTVARIKDHRARYYALARILLEEPFTAIMALNPSTLLVLFEQLEAERDALIADVARGGLRDDLPFGPEATAEIVGRYSGNSARAEVLRGLAQDGAFTAARVFPGLELAISWRSPMLGPYLKLLDAHLGGIGARDYLLMASEGVMAVPLKDGQSGGAVAIGTHFYEFIPLADYGTSDAPPTRGAHELTVGEEYVVVLSNSTGLYRYDIGDVVRVTGHRGPTATIEFLHRAGNTSSLTGEKLTEAQVTAAVSTLCQTLGLELESFTLVPELVGLPHYLLLAEAKAEAPPEVWRALQAGLDAAIAAENSEYPSKRSSHRLGPPEVAMVKPGSYAARKARRVEGGAAELQVKPVHLSRDAKIVQELEILERIRAD